MKDQFRKFGLLTLIALLYLSNTGLIYTVHTCLHTGASVIEIPQILHEEEDHCPPSADDISCKDNNDNCCKTENKSQKSCHTHTTEYKKPDIVSVKPEIKINPVPDYSLSADWITFIDFIIPERNIDASHVHNFLIYLKDSRVRTGLQQRVCLSSFIC